jgi:hypothetical protein
VTREKIEKTVRGLKACATCPEWYEDCQAQKCPYLEDSPPGNINCTNILAQDALALVNELDTTINAMMGAYGDSCDAEGCRPDGGDA